MAAMAALQSSFTSLSLSSNSFLGQRLFPCPILPQVRTTDQPPCLVSAKLKHWERKDCKPNSLPIVHKMHVKIGDTVKVISGSEKGKIGEVTKLYKHNSTIIIKDVNLKTKHMKAKGEGEPGQIIKIEGPVHSSNVMLYSKEKEVTSRVGHKVLEDGSKVRYLIKTGEIIDSAEKWKEVMKNKKETEIAVAA
ncbi:large ribosomal subunit protein uL24c-like [Silene latifolia]|uniref:large ribosomal subunit protein uL24c-like n=1 Tax=Silene latifolia TaxID=37657 RepID=UPI003D78B0AF